jgi:molecular chaperone GrpE
MSPSSKPSGEEGGGSKARPRTRKAYRLRRRRYAAEMPDEPAGCQHDGGTCAHAHHADPSDTASQHETEAKLRIAETRAEAAEQELRVRQLRLRELEARTTRLQSDIDALQKAREEAKKIVEAAKERTERLQAEMDNMRKRTQREREEMRKFAAEQLLNQLFTVLDHFSLSMDSMMSAANIDSVVQGVTMIYREFTDVLAQNGLNPLNPLGEFFDPKYHDAVATHTDPAQEDNIIVQVLRPGFVLHDKVLRPAMVAVNKRPVDEKPAPPPKPPAEELGMGSFGSDIEFEIEYEEPKRARDKVGTGASRGPIKPKRAAEPLDEAWKFLETRYEEKERD